MSQAQITRLASIENKLTTLNTNMGLVGSSPLGGGILTEYSFTHTRPNDTNAYAVGDAITVVTIPNVGAIGDTVALIGFGYTSLISMNTSFFMSAYDFEAQTDSSPIVVSGTDILRAQYKSPGAPASFVNSSTLLYVTHVNYQGSALIYKLVDTNLYALMFSNTNTAAMTGSEVFLWKFVIVRYPQ
jgi:hypothetical protein